MPPPTLRRRLRLTVALTTLLGAATIGVAQQSERPLVPEAFPLTDAAGKAVAAPWLDDDERHDIRIFHGVWDERDLDTPARRAAAALLAWELDDPALSNPDTPAELRAEARLRAGEIDAALALLEELDSTRASRLRAEAFEQIGRFDDANDAVTMPAEQLMDRRLEDASALTDGVLAMQVRARVNGQPARDFQTMVTLLGRAHQDLDRLYWPARLAEARLLADKDNTQEAVQALHETLSLNPRSSDAWFALGRIALERFDFDGVRTAVRSLQRLNATHPLAMLLLAESALVQNDPDTAQELLSALLQRFPSMRPALALQAATHAVFYDDEAMQAALDRYDELSPGSPVAYLVTGRQLAFDRQYGVAADTLEVAIRRQPNWPAPRIELGLLELQSGRDANALNALEAVAEIDPYNKRAANSLFLLRELASFRQVESDHFLIRWRPGIDEVVAAMMPDALDEMHEDLVRRFQFVPEQKTVIEVMPDHEFFSVRITGMPWIHTIAACTGPVIAMEVPREGPQHLHLGPYDWLQVLRHEYVHTITLGQTRNRIPHWLTEAAAVSMELAPRDAGTCEMLARELEQGTLFDLDEINWAFVRPRRPQDRGLAYAQGAWMVEFMNERFGESALVRLLGLYFDGKREAVAMPEALGISRDQFLEEFLAWAQEQVRDWGLDPQPPMSTLTDRLREADPEVAEALRASRQARLEAIASAMTDQIGMPKVGDVQGITADLWPELRRPPVTIDNDTLAEWREEFPDHPDLLLLELRRTEEREGGPTAAMVPLLKRYIELRPVDPYPHRKLAQLHLAGDDPLAALPHLEFLDVREEKNDAFALELARLYRVAGETDRAYEKALKAARTNPYRPATRELAAAAAIEAGRLDAARDHIHALTLLEPERDQHRKRLEALERLRERRGATG